MTGNWESHHQNLQGMMIEIVWMVRELNACLFSLLVLQYEVHKRQSNNLGACSPTFSIVPTIHISLVSLKCNNAICTVFLHTACISRGMGTCHDFSVFSM